MASNKKHILVVEDNFIAGTMNKRCFESLGCQVDLVANGSEAVKLVLKNHYDGIFMDIGLPIMNGVEACKAIRKYEAEHHFAPVPISHHQKARK